MCEYLRTTKKLYLNLFVFFDTGTMGGQTQLRKDYIMNSIELRFSTSVGFGRWPHLMPVGEQPLASAFSRAACRCTLISLISIAAAARPASPPISHHELPSLLTSSLAPALRACCARHGQRSGSAGGWRMSRSR